MKKIWCVSMDSEIKKDSCVEICVNIDNYTADRCQYRLYRLYDKNKCIDKYKYIIEHVQKWVGNDYGDFSAYYYMCNKIDIDSFVDNIKDNNLFIQQLKLLGFGNAINEETDYIKYIEDIFEKQ